MKELTDLDKRWKAANVRGPKDLEERAQTIVEDAASYARLQKAMTNVKLNESVWKVVQEALSKL
jgi:hypothetical protein